MKNHPCLPPLPWRGSCQCGQVRYRLNRMPLTLYCCHCSECQKQSASMHGMSMIVRAADIEITGETRIWTRPTDSGNTTDCCFCPDCGSRVYHRGSQRKESGMLTLKAGSLDVIAAIEPVGHIWLKRRQAGFRGDPAVLHFDGQPDDYGELIAAFAGKYGQAGEREA
ncbi:MAG: GFA family protein [Nitratireductor sp.]|nr:GFA family protein [Nitratireductor sp.]